MDLSRHISLTILFLTLLLLSTHREPSSSRLPSLDGRCVVNATEDRLPSLSCPRKGKEAGEELSPHDTFVLGRPMDIGRASEEELLLLPGIGRSRARAIVELRRDRQGIRSIEELLDVRGIGPHTLKSIRPFITIGSDHSDETRSPHRSKRQ